MQYTKDKQKAYREIMFGKDKISDAEYYKKIHATLQKAHEMRQLEINLYWKYAFYYWGFQIAFLAVLIVLITRDVIIINNSIVIFLLAIIALYITTAWYYTTKSLKAWQKNWETHIIFLENEIIGNLYKIVFGNKSNFYLLNRINISVIRIIWLFWLIIAVYFIFCMPFITEILTNYNAVIVKIITYITMPYIGILIIFIGFFYLVLIIYCCKYFVTLCWKKQFESTKERDITLLYSKSLKNKIYPLD